MIQWEGQWASMQDARILKSMQLNGIQPLLTLLFTPVLFLLWYIKLSFVKKAYRRLPIRVPKGCPISEGKISTTTPCNSVGGGKEAPQKWVVEVKIWNGIGPKPIYNFTLSNFAFVFLFNLSSNVSSQGFICEMVIKQVDGNTFNMSCWFIVTIDILDSHIQDGTLLHFSLPPKTCRANFTRWQHPDSDVQCSAEQKSAVKFKGDQRQVQVRSEWVH